MSSVSVVLSGNHTKLPRAVVSALGVKPDSRLYFEVEGGGRVVMSAKTGTFSSLARTLPKKRRSKAATNEEIQAAIRKGAAKRYRRSSS